MEIVYVILLFFNAHAYCSFLIEDSETVGKNALKH